MSTIKHQTTKSMDLNILFYYYPPPIWLWLTKLQPQRPPPSEESIYSLVQTKMTTTTSIDGAKCSTLSYKNSSKSSKCACWCCFLLQSCTTASATCELGPLSPWSNKSRPDLARRELLISTSQSLRPNGSLMLIHSSWSSLSCSIMNLLLFLIFCMLVFFQLTSMVLVVSSTKVSSTNINANNYDKISGPRNSTRLIKQIDLIQELIVEQSTKLQWQGHRRNGLAIDHRSNVIYLTDDDDDDHSRDISLDELVMRKTAQVITNANDLSILITMKQNRLNSGTIFAFTNGTHRILEMQSSGRRREVRLHYRVGTTIYTETFDNVDLADDHWHKLSLTISDVQLDLHVDCQHRFRRIIQPLDKKIFHLTNKYQSTNQKTAEVSNLTLWLGQRGLHHFLYKGYLKEVRLISSTNGFRIQCPSDLGTANSCPTCGQFKELKDSIIELEDTVKHLTEKLLLMEERLLKVEGVTKTMSNCDCSKKASSLLTTATWCHVNGTDYQHGQQWKMPTALIDGNKNHRCHQCRCLNGSIICGKIAVDCMDNGDDSLKNTTFTHQNVHQHQKVKSKRCLYNKKIYYEGESFEKWTNNNRNQAKKCYECVCKSYSMRCKEKICPELPCPPEKRIQPDDRCCMICETDFCGQVATNHGARVCHADAECLNLATNYTCHCRTGFKGDGYHTCLDIDECVANDLNRCNQTSTVCVNQHGSYECPCKPGFERNSTNSQYDCTDIDECSTDKHKCHANANCFNVAGGYQCQCKPGFEGDGHNNCKPVCKDSCLNGGQCVGPNTCVCRKGYYGQRCELDVDECRLGIHQCPRHSKCINKHGWYHCQCLDGYYERQQTHPDDSDNDGLLIGLLPWTANTVTLPNVDLECVDINECLNPLLNTCPSDSKCVNLDGGYLCDCTTAQNSTGQMYCPDKCIVDGMERKNGEQWSKSLSKDPCIVCECKHGVVKCNKKRCDCSNKLSSMDKYCCPECQHRMDKVCHHQEDPHKIYRNGQRWTYDCETCECMNGEIDCWNECPMVTCLNAIRMPGDCCLRCEDDDPCQSTPPIMTTISKTATKSSSIHHPNQPYNSFIMNSTNLAGCRHQDRQYKSGQMIKLAEQADKCASCLCQNGRLCCSYTFPCMIDETLEMPSTTTATTNYHPSPAEKYRLHKLTPEMKNLNENDQHEDLMSAIPYSDLVKPFFKQFTKTEFATHHHDKDQNQNIVSDLQSSIMENEVDDNDDGVVDGGETDDDYSHEHSNHRLLKRKIKKKQSMLKKFSKIIDSTNNKIDDHQSNNDWSHEIMNH